MVERRKLKWNRKNTLKSVVPNEPGIYKMYDNNGDLLYVGHSKVLRHRVQSYRQKDCFGKHEHNEKKDLRPKIASYSYKTMPRHKAMELERKLKKRAKMNKL